MAAERKGGTVKDNLRRPEEHNCTDRLYVVGTVIGINSNGYFS
jgi:hypothetical protein